MMKRLILTGFGLLAALGANATLKTWDVDDYVQDGLIVHYDAIRNVGANQPHDSTATSWADISPSGAGGAATEKLAVSGQERGTWTDNAYSTSGWTYMQMANAITLGLEFTVQVACDLDKSYWKENLDNYPCPFGSGEFGVFLDRTSGGRSKTNLVWKADAYSNNGSSGNRASCNWTKDDYISFAITPSNMVVTGTANWPTALARKVNDVPVPALTYTFGGRSGRSGGNCTLGDYHSVRIYSRKLTDDELAWNRRIDEIRFHDRYTFPVTNVIVAADVLGRNGAEAPGFHMVVGSHVFTAGTVSIDGTTYQPVGYALATWDNERGFWGEPVTYEGASYEYVASESSPIVRLAWIWRLASGIERLDVGNYVQDGLIAHYDGIRNMGADGPHSTTTTTWADLVRGDAGTLKITTGATEYGAWTDIGYEFLGYSYFEMVRKLELGSEFTVQLVTDTGRDVFGDDGHPYPNVWGSGEFGIFLDRAYAGAIAATNLFWKTDAYAGSGNTRPRIALWDGKYANAAFDSQFSYMVQAPYWDDGGAHSHESHPSFSPVPPLRYTWGGRAGTATVPTRNCSWGMFYAWRAYSRKLTDAELAWNRDVDEVRFRHALPTTMSNAVVVVSAHDSFLAAEDGVYALGGTYAFTAAQQRLGNSVYAPKYAVETWNNATKEWVRTIEAESDRCVLNEADGTAPRRIVWQWRKEGFSLILR